MPHRARSAIQLSSSSRAPQRFPSSLFLPHRHSPHILPPAANVTIPILTHRQKIRKIEAGNPYPGKQRNRPLSVAVLTATMPASTALPYNANPDFERRFKKWTQEKEWERTRMRSKIQQTEHSRHLQIQRDYSHLVRDLANAKARAAEGASVRDTTKAKKTERYN